jgi:hypothetical protein
MSVFPVLVVCALAEAAANDAPVDRQLGERLSASHWALAPEISWFHYEEPGPIKDEGVFYGATASYTRYVPATYEGRLLRLEGGFSAGHVDYDGALMDGTPYTMEGSHDYLANARFLWGPLWQSPTWANSLYYGLGYRYLQDDSTRDPAGYCRHANYLYLPLGLRASRALGGPWYFEAAGEIDLLLIGLQISEIPESTTDSSNVENWQWPGFGARVSVEARCKTKSVDLALAPFLQYWWIADSRLSSSSTWYEPRNWSLQVGLNLVWRF